MLIVSHQSVMAKKSGAAVAITVEGLATGTLLGNKSESTSTAVPDAPSRGRGGLEGPAVLSLRDKAVSGMSLGAVRVPVSVVDVARCAASL